MKWYDRLLLGILTVLLLYVMYSISVRDDFYKRAYKEHIEKLEKRQDSLTQLSKDYDKKIKQFEIRYRNNTHKQYHVPKSHDSLKSILTDSARYYLSVYARGTGISKDSVRVQDTTGE